MKIVKGDLWKLSAGNVVVISTNGATRKDGACVMGRGVALQAVQKWPDIQFELGLKIKRFGNHVASLGLYYVKSNEANPDLNPNAWMVWAFPVKHHWREMADLELIDRSAIELAYLFRDTLDSRQVFLPCVGCANGGRDWTGEVEPILRRHLNDRFTVVQLP